MEPVLRMLASQVITVHLQARRVIRAAHRTSTAKLQRLRSVTRAPRAHSRAGVTTNGSEPGALCVLQERNVTAREQPLSVRLERLQLRAAIRVWRVATTRSTRTRVQVFAKHAR